MNEIDVWTTRSYPNYTQVADEPTRQVDTCCCGFCKCLIPFLLSILSRLICIFVISYVTLIIFYQTDSYFPLINILFCFAILIDLICFLKKRNEHLSCKPFVLFFNLGMIPALWLQHEVVRSVIQKYALQSSSLVKKYASPNSIDQTEYFDIVLYGTLLIIRSMTPPANEWSFKHSLDLIMHDATYITDLLEFSKILFDSSKKVAINESLKNIVLCTLGFTSTYFSLNTVYRASSINIEMLIDQNVSKLERIEYRLAHDPFVRFLMPCLFFEIPIIIARTIIFSTYQSVDSDTFIFLLKNFISIIVTILTYFEISDSKLDGIILDEPD